MSSATFNSFLRSKNKLKHKKVCSKHGKKWLEIWDEESIDMFTYCDWKQNNNNERKIENKKAPEYSNVLLPIISTRTIAIKTAMENEMKTG